MKIAKVEIVCYALPGDYKVQCTVYRTEFQHYFPVARTGCNRYIMSTEAYSLVEGLLDYCGIDGDGLREDGRLLLTVDAEMALFIVVQGQLIHLSAVLDEAPGQADFYLRLLLENFKNVSDPQYYRYALEPDSKALVISLSLDAAQLDQARFIDCFKLLLEHVERWTRALYLNNADYLALDLQAPARAGQAGPPTGAGAAQQAQLPERV